jgi:hypothetical protein
MSYYQEGTPRIVGESVNVLKKSKLVQLCSNRTSLNHPEPKYTTNRTCLAHPKPIFKSSWTCPVLGWTSLTHPVCLG